MHWDLLVKAANGHGHKSLTTYIQDCIDKRIMIVTPQAITEGKIVYSTDIRHIVAKRDVTPFANKLMRTCTNVQDTSINI